MRNSKAQKSIACYPSYKKSCKKIHKHLFICTKKNYRKDKPKANKTDT